VCGMSALLETCEGSASPAAFSFHFQVRSHRLSGGQLPAGSTFASVAKGQRKNNFTLASVTMSRTHSCAMPHAFRITGQLHSLWGRLAACAPVGNRRLLACLQGVPAGYQPAAG
jgi:hypothetical protein